MDHSLESDLNVMTQSSPISPEILYYFNMEPHPGQIEYGRRRSGCDTHAPGDWVQLYRLAAGVKYFGGVGSRSGYQSVTFR